MNSHYLNNTAGTGRMEGWVELTEVFVYMPGSFTSEQTVTHSASNQARRRATTCSSLHYAA